MFPICWYRLCRCWTGNSVTGKTGKDVPVCRRYVHTTGYSMHVRMVAMAAAVDWACACSMDLSAVSHMLCAQRIHGKMQLQGQPRCISHHVQASNSITVAKPDVHLHLHCCAMQVHASIPSHPAEEGRTPACHPTGTHHHAVARHPASLAFPASSTCSHAPPPMANCGGTHSIRCAPRQCGK